MDAEAKHLWDVVLGLGQLLVIAVGAGWAFWRFRRERTHVPRIEFDLNCRFHGIHDSHIVAEFIATLGNKGSVKFEVHDVFLRIRGIDSAEGLQLWRGNEPRLAFPVDLVNDNFVYKKNYGSVFVEPGVDQKLNYVTKLPANMQILLARAEFHYGASRTHSTERVFDTSPLRQRLYGGEGLR